MTSTPPGAFPPWWRDRAFSLAQIAHIIVVPFDTAYGWFRLGRAIGLPIGGKQRQTRWLFSAADLYFFRLLGSLTHLRLPISPEMLRAVYEFAYDGDEPCLPIDAFRASTTDGAAAIVIEAPKIFDAIVTATIPEATDA